jgi:hypothetical protein
LRKCFYKDFFSWILDMARPVERAIKDDERTGGGFKQVESLVKWIAASGINALSLAT